MHFYVEYIKLNAFEKRDSYAVHCINKFVDSFDEATQYFTLDDNSRAGKFKLSRKLLTKLLSFHITDLEEFFERHLGCKKHSAYFSAQWVLYYNP